MNRIRRLTTAVVTAMTVSTAAAGQALASGDTAAGRPVPPDGGTAHSRDDR